MRIKSPFKDFYDGLMGMDREPTPLYIRKTSSEEVNSNWNGRVFTGGHSMEYSLVGFAGKVYPLLTYRKVGFEKDKDAIHFYSDEEVDRWASENLKKRELEGYLKAKTAKYWYQSNFPYKEEYLPPRFASDKLHERVSIKELFSRAPIWHVRESGKVILSPRLEPLGFARILPPYQAWMELYRFLSNQAQPPMPIPPISNEDMRDIKGFDKWSFKKEKGKK